MMPCFYSYNEEREREKKGLVKEKKVVAVVVDYKVYPIQKHINCYISTLLFLNVFFFFIKFVNLTMEFDQIFSSFFLFF